MCSRRSRTYGRAADQIRCITTTRSRPGKSSRTGACSMFSSGNRLLLLALSMMLPATSFATAAEPGHFGDQKPGHFGYGLAATTEQIAGWDIDVRGDDGAGLPPGKG